MLVIANAGRLPERYKNIVAAIGVFDGVHRGHQRVIGRAVKEARRIKGTSVVVTFYPHPVMVLRPAEFEGYVCSLEQRLGLIESLGADVCYVVPFSRSFARQSAADFARKYLVDRVHADRIVVGGDFHFGSGREGSAASFAAHGLRVMTVPLLQRGGHDIKTRRIKRLIIDGDLPSLKALLGRDYGINGEVVRGKGLGRKLGFPTANLCCDKCVTLPSGIYAVRVGVHKRSYAGVFYIGTRPTIKKHRGVRALEAHLLDFKGNLYGKNISVEFRQRLRDDRSFPDPQALVAAITQDVAKARKYFDRHPV